jgi:hypothetical protein
MIRPSRRTCPLTRLPGRISIEIKRVIISATVFEKLASQSGEIQDDNDH